MNREATWDLLSRILVAKGKNALNPLFLATSAGQGGRPVLTRLLQHDVFLTIEHGFLLFYTGDNRLYTTGLRLAVPKRGHKREDVLFHLEPLLPAVVKQTKAAMAQRAEKQRMDVVRARYKNAAVLEGVYVQPSKDDLPHNFDYQQGSCWVDVHLTGRVTPEDVARIARIWEGMRRPPADGPTPTAYDHIEDE